MIVDLRDYRTAPGARERLVARCEAELFPEQVRLGARFLGTFYDAADSDRFVWLRAMPSMEERLRVLTAFYTDGAMWRKQRDEVNAWIADSDDVLLMTPLAGPAASGGSSEMMMYSALSRVAPRAGTRAGVEAAIVAAGGRPLLTLQTADVKNNYPRHPVREGVRGMVWFAAFEGKPPEIAGVVARRLLPTPSSNLR